MIASIPSLQRPDIPPGKRIESPPRGRRIVPVIRNILDVTMVAVIVATTLYLLDDSNHATRSTAQTVGAVNQNAPQAQLLPSDPRDPVVSSDLATVHRFSDVITRELTSVDVRLHSGAPQQINLRRRYAMQKMLSNAGGTGLNDRVAEIESAIRLRSSPRFNWDRDQPSIEHAIRHLHETAISCGSGALAAAAIEVEDSIEEPDAPK